VELAHIMAAERALVDKTGGAAPVARVDPADGVGAIVLGLHHLIAQLGALVDQSRDSRPVAISGGRGHDADCGSVR